MFQGGCGELGPGAGCLGRVLGRVLVRSRGALPQGWGSGVGALRRLSGSALRCWWPHALACPPLAQEQERGLSWDAWVTSQLCRVLCVTL